MVPGEAMSGPGRIGALFEDGAAIDAALAEAALAAQREARLLGRPLVIWQEGQLTEVPPDPIPAESSVTARSVR